MHLEKELLQQFQEINFALAVLFFLKFLSDREICVSSQPKIVFQDCILKSAN